MQGPLNSTGVTSVSEKQNKKEFPPPKINGSMRAAGVTSSYTCASYGLGAKMATLLNNYEKVIPHYIRMLGKIMQKGFFVLYQDI